MPIKLIGTIILLVAITIFCGFNIGEEYSCNINFIYKKFEDIPVFITILVSFLCGALVVLPFTIRRNKKLSKTAEKPEPKPTSAATGTDSKEEDKTIFKVMMQKKKTDSKNKSAEKKSGEDAPKEEAKAPDFSKF